MGELIGQLCGAGHFCPGNVSIPNPPEFICQKGFMCPEGSPAPIACLTGRQYQLAVGSSTCDFVAHLLIHNQSSALSVMHARLDRFLSPALPVHSQIKPD
jgi:hypothetical protein